MASSAKSKAELACFCGLARTVSCLRSIRISVLYVCFDFSKTTKNNDENNDNYVFCIKEIMSSR